MTLRGLLGKTLRLAVPLYLSTLVLGLIPTAVMMLGVGTLAGDRPWRGDLLGPGWLDLVLEIVMEAYHGGGAPGLALVIIGGVLLLPLTMLVQFVVYGFLAGGVLEALNPLPGPPLSFGAFWAACRRWFWPFFRLSMLGAVIYPILSVSVGAATALAGGVIGPDISTLLQLAVQAIVLGWLELTRAVMVVRGTRSVGEGLRQATRLAVRPLVPLAWLVLGLMSGGLLLVAILPPTVDDPYGVVDLLKALAFGQGVAFLGAWTRVIRLAVAARFAQMAPATRSAPVLSAPPS
jgi:hypothetical protein